jgi:hypothetical protein
MQEHFSSEVIFGRIGARLQKRRLVDPRAHMGQREGQPGTQHRTQKELGFTTLDNEFGKIWISVSKSTLWMLQSVERAMPILSTSMLLDACLTL